MYGHHPLVSAAISSGVMGVLSQSKQHACTLVHRLWDMPLKTTAIHALQAIHTVVIKAPNDAADIGSSIANVRLWLDQIYDTQR